MKTKSILIDADDTLWENNIYFEQAFEKFVELLDHSHLSPREVRDVLDDIEREAILVNGYGAANFGRNMQQCFRLLAERPHNEDDFAAITNLAEQIVQQPLKIFEGVEEALAYLSERHRLTLFSKGHPEEQHHKIERSGLRPYFAACRVVREKNAASYRRLMDEIGTEPAQSWMVGNSPKSDINPALEAGLGAVLVPHPHTWSLEREEVPPTSPRFRIVQSFSDLKDLF